MMELNYSTSKPSHKKTDDERAFPPPSLTLKFDFKSVQVTHTFGGKTTTEELGTKLKKTEELNPGHAFESPANPALQNPITQNSKVQCPRCEFWFYADEFESHMNVHSSKILEWLYLGGYRNSSNYKELTIRTQIGYILNVSMECENTFPREFTYKKYDLEDSPKEDISSYFEEACEFLEEARIKAKRVLVHCIQGISRSASFVIAYLIMKQGMSLREAYEHVLSKRSIIKPNPGFVSQLIKFEVKHRGSSSISETEVELLFSRTLKR